jgi:hypothetical protein
MAVEAAPNWARRIRALREARGLSIAQAAAGMRAPRPPPTHDRDAHCPPPAHPLGATTGSAQ